MAHNLWAYIEDGEIKDGPCALPKSWGNISGFHLLGETAEGRDRLKLLGWLPWDNTPPNFDPETHKATWDGKAFEVKDGIAKPIWNITVRDIAKEEAEQEAALRAELGAIKERLEVLLDKAFDPKTSTIPDCLKNGVF